MSRASKIRLRTRHALLGAGAAAAILGASLSAALAGGAPAPFYKHGTNGFSAPSNGAAMTVNEGLGSNGALLTSTSGAPSQAGFGLVGVRGGDGTAKTFGELNDVQTQFNVTQGTCAGGAPRWAIDVANPSNPSETQSLLVNFDNNHQPFGGCEAGAQQETNIINNPTTAWFVGNANVPSTYAAVLATYGSWKLQDVEVILDAGWAQGSQLNPNIQQVLLQNLKVNSATYFPVA
jgi:hypothetical protein